ncbi:HTH-type transcriptional regulator TtgR [compost metagenome]
MRQQSINFFRDLEITLGNAVRLGHLPQGLDLRRATTLLHCTLDGYIINWLHFPERINLIQEADFLLDTLFGLLANPSPSLLRRP